MILSKKVFFIMLLVFSTLAYAADPMYDYFDSIMYSQGVFRIRAWVDYGRAASYIDSTFAFHFTTVPAEQEDMASYPNDGKYTKIKVPLSVTYAITDYLDAGLLGQFVSRSLEDSISTTSSSGIGDTWIYTRFGLSKDPVFNIRLAGKIPTGSWKDIAEGKEEGLEIGDGQMDLELALNGTFPAYPERVKSDQFEFKFKHWSFEYLIGLRYRMKRTWTYEQSGQPAMDCEWQPPMEIPFCFREKINVACNTYFWFLGFNGNLGMTDNEVTMGSTTTTSKINNIMFHTGLEIRAGEGFYINAMYQGTIGGQNTPYEWHVLGGGLGIIF
ncbi:MAG: hypothetical protein JXA60_08415 [Candidatus Coatesbacteria bacterium]|nr:hypothetical protein [Candidatus Coatesbacteria bacterium]